MSQLDVSPSAGSVGNEIWSGRSPISLSRIQIEGKAKEKKSAVASHLWFDARQAQTSRDSVLSRVAQSGYTGILLTPELLDAVLPFLSPQTQAIIELTDSESTHAFADTELFASLSKQKRLVIASHDEEVLALASEWKIETCLRAYVDDGASLHESIERGYRYNFLAIRFRDPTNIPLELVIATLQSTHTILIKEINAADDVDDAVVTLGVMECGADGVMYSPQDHGHLDTFLQRLEQSRSTQIQLEPAKVVRSIPVGMGYRSCIDLATLFTPEEGMLVGSTSQGGILCCPEVFYLPYMELRPFRVNAGAVHCYVYNFDNRTDYMSELKAGSSVMVVGLDGKTRRAAVGRMKTEVRPLRLIEAVFASGETINILMQDDWHVRIFSADGKPRNITDLKQGEEILAYRADPGRHVGIKVDETILEN